MTTAPLPTDSLLTPEQCIRQAERWAVVAGNSLAPAMESCTRLAEFYLDLARFKEACRD